jgi:HAD superfamily hydrolase (TIGR01509 family)
MTRPSGLPPRVDAVIFDFDETLIDLEPQHTRAYDELCRELGDDYARMPEQFRNGSGRRVIDDIHEMRAFFGWTGTVEELFERRQRVFEEACRTASLELMPGAETLVRALFARGVTLAITSSAVRGPIVEILERFDLLRCFSLIVDGSEVVHGKPDPQSYLLTAERLGATPGRCIVFEDSNVGVIAAKAAGMWCVGIANPHAQTIQDLSCADLRLRSLLEFDPVWVTRS